MTRKLVGLSFTHKQEFVVWQEAEKIGKRRKQTHEPGEWRRSLGGRGYSLNNCCRPIFLPIE